MSNGRSGCHRNQFCEGRNKKLIPVASGIQGERPNTMRHWNQIHIFLSAITGISEAPPQACIRATHRAFLTKMACLGHISWQQKHEMQPLFLNTALPFSILIMCEGQLSLHFAQPMHFSLSTCG